MADERRQCFTTDHLLFSLRRACYQSRAAKEKKRGMPHVRAPLFPILNRLSKSARLPALYFETFTSTFDGTLEPRNSPPFTTKKPTTSTSSRIAMIATMLTALLPPPSSPIEITLLQSFRPNVLVNAL